MYKHVEKLTPKYCYLDNEYKSKYKDKTPIEYLLQNLKLPRSKPWFSCQESVTYLKTYFNSITAPIKPHLNNKEVISNY